MTNSLTGLGKTMKDISPKSLKKILIIEIIFILLALFGVAYVWFFKNNNILMGTDVPEAVAPSVETQQNLHQTTLTQDPVITPAVQRTETVFPTLHTVQPNETLSGIAASYGLTLDELLALNPSIPDPDFVQIGAILVVSQGERGVITIPSQIPTSAEREVPINYVFMPSLISTDPYELRSVYPQEEVLLENELIVHYQPESFTDLYNDEVFQEILTAYHFVKTKLGYPFTTPIHLYLAGSVFQGNESLRGLTHSTVQRIFLLVDGTWMENERIYLFAHEFTHIFANYQLGFYRSPMLHEGLATYLPNEFLRQEGHLSLFEVCAAMLESDRLVPLNILAESGYGLPYFAGHNRSALYYYESACFTSYLINQYGFENFTRVFTTLDYQGVYGRDIADLDSEFRDSLQGLTSFEESEGIVATFDNLSSISTQYFNQTQYGQHFNFEAYLFLDKARYATFNGDPASAEIWLEEYYQALGLE